MTVGPVRGADRLALDARRQRLASVRQGDSNALTRRMSTKTVLIADGPDGEMAVALEGTGDAEVTPGKNIANEPRDTLAFTRVRLSADAVGPLGRRRLARRRCTAAVRWRGRR